MIALDMADDEPGTAVVCEILHAVLLNTYHLPF